MTVWQTIAGVLLAIVVLPALVAAVAIIVISAWGMCMAGRDKPSWHRKY